MANTGMVDDPLSLKNVVLGTAKEALGMNRGMVAPSAPTPINRPVRIRADGTVEGETTAVQATAPATAVTTIDETQMPPGMSLLEQIRWREEQQRKALNQ